MPCLLIENADLNPKFLQHRHEILSFCIRWLEVNQHQPTTRQSNFVLVSIGSCYTVDPLKSVGHEVASLWPVDGQPRHFGNIGRPSKNFFQCEDVKVARYQLHGKTDTCWWHFCHALRIQTPPDRIWLRVPIPSEKNRNVGGPIMPNPFLRTLPGSLGMDIHGLDFFRPVSA